MLLSIVVGVSVAPAAAAVTSTPVVGGLPSTMFLTDGAGGTNKLYRVDMTTTPMKTTLFWSDTTSGLDQVAVSKDFVAWSGGAGATSSAYQRVLIARQDADPALLASTPNSYITNQYFPGYKVGALAADPNSNRFYAALTCIAADQLRDCATNGTSLITQPTTKVYDKYAQYVLVTFNTTTDTSTAGVKVVPGTMRTLGWGSCFYSLWGLALDQSTHRLYWTMNSMLQRIQLTDDNAQVDPSAMVGGNAATPWLS